MRKSTMPTDGRMQTKKRTHRLRYRDVGRKKENQKLPTTHQHHQLCIQDYETSENKNTSSICTHVVPLLVQLGWRNGLIDRKRDGCMILPPWSAKPIEEGDTVRIHGYLEPSSTPLCFTHTPPPTNFLVPPYVILGTTSMLKNNTFCNYIFFN